MINKSFIIFHVKKKIKFLYLEQNVGSSGPAAEEPEEIWILGEEAAGVEHTVSQFLE